MVCKRNIHKITLECTNEFYVVSDFEDQVKLSILLIDINQCEAFTGVITDIELRSLSANLRMNFNIFMSLTTKALTQNEVDDLKFLYSFDQNCEEYVFKWKSMDNDETINTLGIVKMVKSDYTSVIKNVFNIFYEELSCLNKKVIDTENKFYNVDKERENAVCLLAEATQVKETIEMELYAKFMLVLNEKKRKIRDLELNSKEKVSKVLKPLKSKPIKLTKNKLHQISDSSDEVDDHLDDLNKPGPSNIKHDQSLLFDYDEPVLSISPSKIRNRNVIKQTFNPKPVSNVEKSRIYPETDTESEADLLNNL